MCTLAHKTLKDHLTCVESFIHLDFWPFTNLQWQFMLHQLGGAMLAQTLWQKIKRLINFNKVKLILQHAQLASVTSKDLPYQYLSPSFAWLLLFVILVLCYSPICQ